MRTSSFAPRRAYRPALAPERVTACCPRDRRAPRHPLFAGLLPRQDRPERGAVAGTAWAASQRICCTPPRCSTSHRRRGRSAVVGRGRTAAGLGSPAKRKKRCATWSAAARTYARTRVCARHRLATFLLRRERYFPGPARSQSACCAGGRRATWPSTAGSGLGSACATAMPQRAPHNEKGPAVCGAFHRCAEEDSNLHPVIPDQALNLVCAIVARSISHSRAKDRRAPATDATYEPSWRFSNPFSNSVDERPTHADDGRAPLFSGKSPAAFEMEVGDPGAGIGPVPIDRGSSRPTAARAPVVACSRSHVRSSSPTGRLPIRSLVRIQPGAPSRAKCAPSDGRRAPAPWPGGVEVPAAA